jgi:light-harvesting complex I chlorophyll a/b binding protein 4
LHSLITLYPHRAAALQVSAFLQIILFAGFVEFGMNKGAMTMDTMFADKKRVPGDYGWDPLQLGTPENIDTYKARELENGRLAMIAIGGMIHGSFVTGTGAFGSTF